ncbi:hypothetical protein ACWEOV_36275 [Streptomyces sp. NPDC004365]
MSRFGAGVRRGVMAADHADLVAVGPDGREAVRAGLKELERYGYLVRERLRRANRTLGEVVYSITDRPATLGVALLEAPSTLDGRPARRRVRGGDPARRDGS